MVKSEGLVENEEVLIEYEAKNNAYLLVHYGFAVEDNPYDCVRANSISTYSFFDDVEELDE